MRLRVVLVVALALLTISVVLTDRSENFRKMDFRRLPARAGWQLPEEVVEALQIRLGDHVADLGAGDGYFVAFLADAVGPLGKLYAVDVAESAVRKLTAKVEKEQLHNVEVVKGSTTDAGLPDREIDLVFLCDVYHHIDDRVAYFSRLRTDLASDGRVAVVEPRDRGFGRLVSPAGHATPRDVLQDEMEAAGYRLESSLDFLPVQNLMIFRPVA